MITRLSPEQVSQNWDFLAWGIEQALPPIAGALDRMTRILESCLSGGMHVWLLWDKKEEGVELNGVALTATEEDFCSRSRSLLIYSLYAYRPLSKGTIMEGYKTLQQWAKEIGCGQIAAYTNQTRVVELARSQGADVGWHYLTMSVGGV